MVVNNKVNIIIQAVDNATAPIKKMSGSFSGLKSSMESMVWPIKAVWVWMVWLWWFWLKIAWDFEQTRISFETMLWDTDKAKKLLWELSDFAAKTPFEFPEIAQAWKSLLAFWFEAENIQANLTRLWDIASWLNIPFTELSDIYGKIRVQWRLYQEDINQLTWRWIPIIWELAKQFWVTESEVKKLVETWKVWFPEIEQAFIDLTSEWSKFGWMMEKQSQSLNWVLSTLKDNLKMTLMEIMWINKEWEIAAWSLIERSKEMVTALTTVMEENKTQIQWFWETTITVIENIAKAIWFLISAIYSIWEAIWMALSSISIFIWNVTGDLQTFNETTLWIIDSIKNAFELMFWWIDSKIKAMKSTISSLKNAFSATSEKVSNLVSWQRAVWWAVTGWKTYLVWERWPELFTPSTTWSIIANKNLWTSSWMNISINMWWVSVSNSADENRLVEKIKNELTRTLQLQKYSIS